MCNLYSHVKGPKAIRDLAVAMGGDWLDGGYKALGRNIDNHNLANSSKRIAEGDRAIRYLLGLISFLSFMFARAIAADTTNVSADSNARISILNVYVSGQKEFLSPDSHWLQLHLKIENIGKSVFKLIDLKKKLEDGSTIPSAQSVNDLAKPPTSELTQGAGIVAFGITSMTAGIVIPFASPIINAIGLGAMARSHDNQIEVLRAALKAGPHADYVPPNSNVVKEV